MRVVNPEVFGVRLQTYDLFDPLLPVRNVIEQAGRPAGLVSKAVCRAVASAASYERHRGSRGVGGE